MALDTLQLSPTVINTDKLVQAAGNLMAKEKAESTARQKSMADQLAKIDSAKLRKADIGDFRKLYDEVLTYGAQNSNRMNDIEVQSELNRKLNALRGFAEFSARNKEEYDIPLLKRKFDSDLDPNAGSYIEEIINTPSSKLGSIDLARLSNVDKKDYLTEFFQGFKGSVEKEIGSTTFKNTKETYGDIINKAESYVASSLNTPTGEKAFNQFIKSRGIDVSTKEGKVKALSDFSDALFNNFVARADVSVKQDEARKPSEFDLTMQLGFSPRKAPVLGERLKAIDGVFRGDKTYLTELQRFLPAGSKVSGDVYTSNVKIQVPEYANDGTPTGKIFSYAFDRNDKVGFLRGINSVIETLGTRKGYGDINNEELSAYAERTGYNPVFKATKAPYLQQKANKGTVTKSNQPTDVSNLFKK